MPIKCLYKQFNYLKIYNNLRNKKRLLENKWVYYAKNIHFDFWMQLNIWMTLINAINSTQNIMDSTVLKCI